MQYVGMIIMGAIIGILARFIYPGAVPMGLIMSAVLGIAGSFLAGFVGKLIQGNAEGQIKPAGFIYSIVGAIAVIFIARHLLHLV